MKTFIFAVFLLACSMLFPPEVLAQNGAPPAKIVDGSGINVVLGATGQPYDSGIATLPNTPTVLTTKTTKIQLIFCSNISGLTATVTITDNQGSPMTYFNAIPVNANQVIVLAALTIGLPMKGIVWSASAASALNCQVEGVQ